MSPPVRDAFPKLGVIFKKRNSFKNIDSQSLLKPDLVIQELWPAETRTKRAADVATTAPTAALCLTMPSFQQLAYAFAFPVLAFLFGIG
jgi:hypothetical protein